VPVSESLIAGSVIGVIEVGSRSALHAETVSHPGNAIGFLQKLTRVPRIGHPRAMPTGSIRTLVDTARSRRSLPPPAVRRMLRQAGGLAQHDVAAALGVTDSAVSRWESGARTPRGEHLDAYIEVLAALAREAV
jgi:DNA-binding transcriptional regulator YiaG